MTDLKEMIRDAGKMAAPAVQGEPAIGVVPSRDDLIQCLLATRGQSEGTTADAILSMLTAAPQPAEQQPAEGEEIMVNTPYDVFTLPLRLSGLGGKGPRFVVHVPGPGQPAAPDVTALVEALENAARSLRTISKKAGTGEFMSEMYQVRGYAESRAWCAEEDLAAFRQGGVE